jgi:rhomboid protease GluP
MKSRSAGFTTAMIAICWLVFVLDFLSPKTQGIGEITIRLALFPDAVLHGQWWRLVSYGFVHANWYHILVNSIALFQAGDFVEYVYGSRRYAVIYLVALFGGGLAAYMATVGTPAFTLGASGAILGIFGAMAVLAYKLPPLRKELLRAALVPVILTLGIGFFTPGISNAAHIGGFLTGVVAAALITPVHGREIIRQFAPAQISPSGASDSGESAWEPPRRS